MRRLEIQICHIQRGVQGLVPHGQTPGEAMRAIADASYHGMPRSTQSRELLNPITNGGAASISDDLVISSPDVSSTQANGPYDSAREYSSTAICFEVTHFGSCHSFCTCACHRDSRRRSPKILDCIFGAFSAGYNYVPFMAQPCNIHTCQRRATPRATFTYAFPRWFCNRVVTVNASNMQNRAPELLLRVLRRRPTLSRVFIAILMGRVKEVQALFREGHASVFDIDEDGFSVLQVHLSPSVYTTKTC